MDPFFFLNFQSDLLETQNPAAPYAQFLALAFFVSFLLLLLMARCGFYRLRSLSYAYFWASVINKLNFISLCALTEGLWAWEQGGGGFPFVGAALYASARDSPIPRKQIGMFSLVLSFQRDSERIIWGTKFPASKTSEIAPGQNVT